MDTVQQPCIFGGEGRAVISTLELAGVQWGVFDCLDLFLQF